MNKFSFAIHYLRAFASLAVVLHHVPAYLFNHGMAVSWDFNVGAAGVDIFFIISGYVMFFSTRKVQGFSASRQFIMHRFIRIVPLYWTTSLILGLLVLFIPKLFLSYKITEFDLVKSILFIPVFDINGELRPILPVGWTLYYEMMFYGFIYIFLLFNSKKPAIYAGATITTMVIVFDIFGVNEIKNYFYLFSPICIEFFIGVLLAYFISSFRRYSKKSIFFSILLSSAGFLLLVIYEISFTRVLQQDWDRLIFWGFPSFLIVLGLTVFESNRKIPNIIVLNFLGNASYAIYLIHGLAFSMIWKIFGSTLQKIDTTGYLSSGVLLIFSVLAGCIVHFFYETKLNGYIFRKIQHEY